MLMAVTGTRLVIADNWWAGWMGLKLDWRICQWWVKLWQEWAYLTVSRLGSGRELWFTFAFVELFGDAGAAARAPIVLGDWGTERVLSGAHRALHCWGRVELRCKVFSPYYDWVLLGEERIDEMQFFVMDVVVDKLQSLKTLLFKVSCLNISTSLLSVLCCEIFLQLLDADLIGELIFLQMLIPKDILMWLLHDNFNRWFNNFTISYLGPRQMLRIECLSHFSLSKYFIYIRLLVRHEIIEILKFTAIFCLAIFILYVQHNLICKWSLVID